MGITVPTTKEHILSGSSLGSLVETANLTVYVFYNMAAPMMNVFKVSAIRSVRVACGKYAQLKYSFVYLFLTRVVYVLIWYTNVYKVFL